MAIAGIHYFVIRKLREQNILSNFNSILEIGEQNWYGDISPKILLDDIKIFAPDSKKDDLTIQLNSIIKEPSKSFGFDIAKIFYQVFFHAESIESIDMNGTSSSMRLDLNFPHDLGKQFDCIINLGTAEHVFNVFQVFSSIHNWIKKDGIVIHNLPMYGEIDHGFYNFHPTFFWDLSYVNKYDNIYIAKSTMKTLTRYMTRESCTKDILSQDKTSIYGIWSIYKKISNDKFKIPMQGVYDENLKDKNLIKDSWIKQREITDSSS
tara:strand:+ start:640 stop:1431 length:792 start_codon:yes stop_codon:yes gene_type:complete